MADAYRYAESNQPSPEITMLRAIDRFGVMAVCNRPYLYAGEFYAMQVAETIVKGYKMRTKSANFAEFAASNPQLAKLLVDSQKIAEGIE